MKHSASRIFYLWLLFLLFGALLAELGHIARLIPADVLASLAHHSGSWWQKPAWLHALNSLFLLFVSSWYVKSVLVPAVPRTAARIGGIAAVLLSSHLSPIYIVVPYVPLAGTALASVILVLSIVHSKAELDPRSALRLLMPESRSERVLWGALVLFVVYNFVNQLGESVRLVSRVTDFRTFYEAAVALARGNDPYGATGRAYFYPPTFAFYFRFLTWLPVVGASHLWFTAKAALVVWSLGAVESMLLGYDMTETRRRWFIAGIVLVAARFIVSDLQYGNTNTFVLWLIIVAVVLDFRGRSFWPGVAVAAAIGVKVVPALFVLYFLVRGRIRIVLWTAVWLLAFNLLPFLIEARIMSETWGIYLADVAHGKLSSPLAQPDNQSLWGFLNRFHESPVSQLRAIWIACSALLTGTAVWATIRARGNERLSRVGAASLFFLLGLLVSPGSWVVHYCAVLLPMAYLLRVAMAEGAHARYLWLVFIMANLVFSLTGWSRLTVRLSTEQSWFVAAGCLLFFTVAFLVAHRRERYAEASAEAAG
jgi:hypothetical protein